MRHILSRLCLTILGLAGLARADYSFPFPAGSYLDSAAVNAAIPLRAFSDSLSSTRLSMANQVMRLDVSWGNVPKWRPNAGMQLPFNKLWAPVDFSYVSAVSFKYKTSDAKTHVQFAPNSDLYPGVEEGVMLVAAFGPSTGSKIVTVSLPAGVDYLDWMLKQHPEQATLSWDDVKTSITSLQFEPMPVHDDTGDTVTVSKSWLEISEVAVVGDFCSMVSCDPNPMWISSMGMGCTGNFQKLSAFEGVNPKRNTEGGDWYGFVDSASSIPGRSRGVSRLLDRNGGGTGLSFLPAKDSLDARVEVTALLDKGNAALHPYAGWAGVGTGFSAGTSGDSVRDLSGLKAISFQLALGDSFDVQNLTGVWFQARNRSVGDSVYYGAGITADLVGGLGKSKEACIDVNRLRQPAWFRGSLPSLPLSDILGFEWLVKINSDARAKALPSTFSIGDVKLWGTNAANGVSRSRTGEGPALVASYSGALRLSYALKDASFTKIEVLRMDGRSVASFEAPSSVQAQAFPVTLGQGTYLAVVRNGSIRLVAPFVVAH